MSATKSGEAGGGKGAGEEAAREEIEARVLKAIRDVRFGSVEVVVHGGRVVQLEKRERTRFDGKRG